MINLMPTDEKRQLSAARINTILVRYMIVVVLAGLFAGLVLAGSLFLLTQTRDSAKSLIEANDTKASAYSSTQAELSALSTNLTDAKSVLDQQTSYAKTLRRIGEVMPAGTVLDSLNLSANSLSEGAPMTLKIYAKDNQSAVAARSQFESSSFFSSVSLDSVSETGGINDYPASATLTLTLNRTIAR